VGTCDRESSVPPGRPGGHKIDKKRTGKGDRAFCSVFLPQADVELTWVGEPQGCGGMNIFQGGFLAWTILSLRSQRSFTDRRIHRAIRRNQLDGDVHAEPLLAIALELAAEDLVTKDVAASSGNTFIYIANA